MLTHCKDCGIGFDTDKLEPWGDCEECFNKKVAEADHPPCPSCESLRAEIEALRGKVRELDAWLTEKGDAQSDQFGNYGDSYREGKADAYDAAGTKLRRLRLLEDDDATR